jgi:hypothetical protein
MDSQVVEELAAAAAYGEDDIPDLNTRDGG